MKSRITKDSGVPLYLQIQNLIQEEIAAGVLKPGASVYSEHELAAQLDVSRLTVRRAYSEMAKRRILYSIHGKGTFVSETALSAAPALRAATEQRGLTIAVVFPEVSHFFGPVLHALEEEARMRGMQINLVFNSSVRAENEALDRVLANNEIGGLIISPFRQTKSRNYQKYNEILRAGIPTVMVGKPPFHLHFDSVYCDDVVATYDLITDLIARGHRRIVWLMDSAGDTEAVSERREGYLRAMDEAGAEPDIYDLSADSTERKLLEAASSSTRPTAICCDTDISAARIMNLLLANGVRVPDDVSLVGYDNYDLCNTLPVPLSSIDQPKTKMGQGAFELLYDRISSPQSTERYPAAHHTVHVPSLVERKSIRNLSE
jgi:DNA-binding LacI/PurR family transcriptional regulator